MPESCILTSATILHINLSYFSNLLDTRFIEIIGVEGNSEIPAIWRKYTRYWQP
ncbi:MAG: hypothetical protein FD155_3459 [Bacteroidetes bacterium]|nr:MAG: hypothetical protein FD155_3459 [Bacteroidota bacterium]